jgi:hypothetical protein
MEGRPVWLASLSRRDASDAILATGTWSKRERKRLIAYLRSDVLAGVGDPSVERVFRMNSTLCVHRLCTAEEAAYAMSMWAGVTHRDLAGQPVEVIEEVGCTSALSTRPCDEPLHEVIIPDRPDLWVPRDCGSCPSCVARCQYDAPTP